MDRKIKNFYATKMSATKESGLIVFVKLDGLSGAFAGMG